MGVRNYLTVDGETLSTSEASCETDFVLSPNAIPFAPLVSVAHSYCNALMSFSAATNMAFSNPPFGGATESENLDFYAPPIWRARSSARDVVNYLLAKWLERREELLTSEGLPSYIPPVLLPCGLLQVFGSNESNGLKVDLSTKLYRVAINELRPEERS